MSEVNVSGRVVAVTGGARGIGAAIAEELARAGARVAVGDLDEEAAVAQAEKLGNGAIGHGLDVTSTESFEAFLDAVEERLGPLDVLVNNAGIMWVGAFTEESEGVAHRQFEVNFHGTARGMRLAIPRMLRRGSGHVVNVASAASKVTPAGESTYAATKHAVYGYTNAVRAELHGKPVQLTLVLPVVVATDLAAGTNPGRGSPTLTPADVGRKVLDAVRNPRDEVFVPGRAGPLLRFMTALPPRMRDRMARAIVPNQIELTDHSARTDYESKLERN